jgi:hypothetical protein
MKGPLAGCVSFVNDRKNHRPARRCCGSLLAKLPPRRCLTAAEIRFQLLATPTPTLTTQPSEVHTLRFTSRGQSEESSHANGLPGFGIG